MTPTGRNAIVALTIVVAAGAGILLHGFFSLGSDPSVRRHHHRRAEVPRSPTAVTGGAVEAISGAPVASPRPPNARSQPARSTNRTERTSGATPEPERAPEGEFVLTEQTADAVAMQRTVQERMDGAVSRNPGSDVAFVDCAEKPCRARAEAKDLETLTSFLRDLSGTYDGHVRAELRERLDPFMGRSFQADLLVGTNDTAPVPTEPLTFQ